MTQEETTSWALNKIESAMKPKQFQTYLGDGVYATFVNGMLLLTAENGVRVTDAIYLEPQVFQALERFAEQIGWRPE